MFNSLKYAKKLEEVGLSREQAEMHVFILGEVMESNLATKQDLTDLKTNMRQEMTELRTELRQELGELRTEFRELKLSTQNEIKQSEQRMTIRLGTIVSLSIGVAVTLVKLIS